MDLLTTLQYKYVFEFVHGIVSTALVVGESTFMWVQLCGQRVEKGERELTSAEFRILENWISEQNVAMWREFESFRTFFFFFFFFLPILKLRSSKFLEMCDFGGESRFLRAETCWNGGLANH